MKLFWRLAGLGLVVPCGVLVAGILFSGCAATKEQAYFNGSAGASQHSTGATGAGTETLPADVDKEVFSIGDQVIVTFSDPALKQHDERIKDDGTITLYLVGAVKAVGTTPGDLQKEIQALYVPK